MGSPSRYPVGDNQPQPRRLGVKVVLLQTWSPIRSGAAAHHIVDIGLLVGVAELWLPLYDTPYYVV